MDLFLDNSVDGVVKVSFLLDTKIIHEEFSLENQNLVSVLDVIFQKNKLTIKDLTGIAVVVGKGRFTATRVATTFANTLSFSLSIPVLAVNGWYEGLFEDLKKCQSGIYVSAQYSAPANIGGKK